MGTKIATNDGASGAAFLGLTDALSSRIAPARQEAAIATWQHDCDVLVVGFGLAGAAAALDAAEGGLDVILIDRFQGGGASQQSGGIVYAGGGTPVQAECGVIDTPEAMSDYLIREVDGMVTDETVRRFCADSVETLAFLQRHGVQFSGPKAARKTSYPPADSYLYFSDNGTVPAFRGALPPAERGHRAKDPGSVPGALPLSGTKPHGGFSEGADMGWYLMAAIKDAVARQPRIRVLRQTRAVGLVLDGGRVTGATVSRLAADGAAARLHGRLEAQASKLTLQLLGLAKPLQMALNTVERLASRAETIRARSGIVLAAGGYIRNRGILARFAAPYLKTFPIGSLGDDGAGLKLGVSAGGVADHMDRISAWRFINPPYNWTKGVVIGRDGTRVANEELYGASLTRAMYEKSGGEAWLVLDKAISQAALAEIGSTDLYAFQQFPVMQAKKSALKADTIEALADKMGVPSSAMRASIDAYSAAATAGTPDPMGKSDACRAAFGDGPFMAVSLTHKTPTNPVTAISTGGLRVREDSGAVVAASGEAIKGLYAAGRNAIGIPSNNYVSGLSLSDCVWSGRRAARSILRAASTLGEAKERKLFFEIGIKKL